MTKEQLTQQVRDTLEDHAEFQECKTTVSKGAGKRAGASQRKREAEERMSAIVSEVTRQINATADAEYKDALRRYESVKVHRQRIILPV